MRLLKLEEMTLEQKIGQLICARGYRDEDDKKFVLEMIKKGAVGAVQGICNNDSTRKNKRLHIEGSQGRI